MTQSEIVRDIVRECRDWRAAGKAVLVGRFGNGKDCGCPMVIVAMSRLRRDGDRTLQDRFCRAFGISQSWSSGFLAGYDAVCTSVDSALSLQKESPSARANLKEGDFMSGFSAGRDVRRELGL